MKKMEEEIIRVCAITDDMLEEDYENFTYKSSAYLDILLAIKFNQLEANGTKICHVPEMDIYEAFGVKPKFTFPDPMARKGWLAIEAASIPKNVTKYIKERLATTRRFTLIRFRQWSTFTLNAPFKYLTWLRDKDDISLDALDLKNAGGHLSVFLVDNQKKTITWIDNIYYQGDDTFQEQQKMDEIFYTLYPSHTFAMCGMTPELEQELINMENYCVPFAFFVAKDLMMQELQVDSPKRTKKEPFGERVKRQVFDIVKPYGYRWYNVFWRYEQVDFILCRELLKELGNPPNIWTSVEINDPKAVTPAMRKSSNPFPTFTKGGYFDELGKI